MRSKIRWPILLAAAVAVVGLGLPASAEHAADPRTNNIHPMGHIVEPASLLNPAVGNPNIHTDIAFWGKHAFQGTWLGFNIRDISAPGNPTQVSHTVCQGNQGDVIVWDNILVRSWNSPAGAGLNCDGDPVPVGFEGLHVFDISDLNDPDLVASVDLSNGAIPGRCGSHTATGVPDLANNRLLVYNSGSQCDGFDVVEIPLGNLAGATYLRTEPSGRNCHDVGVILGDAMMAACAGGDGFTVYTLTGTGSLVNPDQTLSVAVPGVGVGHSAAFSFDGDVLVFGHEPGGGVAPRCRETDAVVDKSALFFDSGTGAFLGQWTIPRPQTAEENCTVHNYNVVPLRNGRDVLTVGNYQAGTWIVDFTDPTDAQTVAWSDPPPLPVPPGSPFGLELGGVWSSYWYNNFIYETNITEGLNVFRFSGRETAGAMRLGHLNPQTQEFTING